MEISTLLKFCSKNKFDTCSRWQWRFTQHLCQKVCSYFWWIWIECIQVWGILHLDILITLCKVVLSLERYIGSIKHNRFRQQFFVLPSNELKVVICYWLEKTKDKFFTIFLALCFKLCKMKICRNTICSFPSRPFFCPLWGFYWQSKIEIIVLCLIRDFSCYLRISNSRLGSFWYVK